MKFGFDSLKCAILCTVFEIVYDGRRWTTDDDDNDGRTPEHDHPINSPFESSAQVS